MPLHCSQTFRAEPHPAQDVRARYTATAHVQVEDLLTTPNTMETNEKHSKPHQTQRELVKTTQNGSRSTSSQLTGMIRRDFQYLHVLRHRCPVTRTAAWHRRGSNRKSRRCRSYNEETLAMYVWDPSGVLKRHCRTFAVHHDRSRVVLDVLCESPTRRLLLECLLGLGALGLDLQIPKNQVKISSFVVAAPGEKYLPSRRLPQREQCRGSLATNRCLARC